MVEVLEWRPWEPTGPCRAPRTSASLPGSDPLLLVLAKLITFRATSFLEEPCEFARRITWAPFRAPYKVSEAGERNVAKRGHGHPCGQQPMDEVDGHRTQGTKTSRLRRRCDRRYGYRSSGEQRSGTQSVSSISVF